MRDRESSPVDIDYVTLTTAGIDIGSTTSHVVMSEVVLERQGGAFSSRFIPIERRVLHRSEVVFTPFDRSTDTIDGDALMDFIDEVHSRAGIDALDLDCGVVVMTGLALMRSNARAIADAFARRPGDFLCVSAGHLFEAKLAAHGSGAAGASTRVGGPVLNVDVGGGTTKVSYIQDGEVVRSCALAVGARLVVLDSRGVIEHIEPTVMPFAQQIGLDMQVGGHLSASDRARLGAAMAECVVACALGELPPWLAGGSEFVLAGSLGFDDLARPEHVTFSGGVSEFLAGATQRSFGDLGADIAAGIQSRAADLPPILETGVSGIRATVLGASQHTVALSGSTVHRGSRAELPCRNLPVVAVRIGDGDLPASDVIAALIDDVAAERLEGPGQVVAVMVDWRGDPSYANLQRLAGGLAGSRVAVAASNNQANLVVVLNHDVAGLVGRILEFEMGAGGAVVLDGLELDGFDFIDIGSRRAPSGVVPVVIKSLLFDPSSH